jgi:glycosyltransferase involved in cell wall biosynthesis
MSAVTAVMPLYDKAAHVEAALQSIFRQTQPPARVIVMDDGSRDGGDALVEALARKDLLLVRQPNAGPGAARNRGIMLAETPFVAFLDADDLWLPDHLARLMRLAETHPGLALYANHLGAMGESPPAGSDALVPDYWSAWRQGLVVSTCAAMVDREAALAVGGFGTSRNRGEDLELWLKLTETRAMAMGGGVGALYRQEASDLTGRPTAEPDAAMLWIERRLGAGDLAPERARTLAAFRARLALLHAAEWIRHGGRAEAKRFLEMAGEAADPALRRKLALLAGPLWPLRRPAIGLRRLVSSDRTLA